MQDFSPLLWDDGQAVSSLGVPNTDLSSQAAAGQQHPVTGQTFYVLQDRKTQHGCKQRGKKGASLYIFL